MLIKEIYASSKLGKCAKAILSHHATRAEGTANLQFSTSKPIIVPGTEACLLHLFSHTHDARPSSQSYLRDDLHTVLEVTDLIAKGNPRLHTCLVVRLVDASMKEILCHFSSM